MRFLQPKNMIHRRAKVLGDVFRHRNGNGFDHSTYFVFDIKSPPLGGLHFLFRIDCGLPASQVC